MHPQKKGRDSTVMPPVAAHSQAVPTDTLLHLLTENAVHITAILEPDSTIRYVSPSIERMLGYPPEMLIGTPAAALVHPDDRPSNVALDPSGSPVRLSQFRARHKDGSWRLM